MNKILDNDGKFAVYDNILTPEEFKKTWDWIQGLNYQVINSSGEFKKIWRVTDGNPMASASWDYTKSPFNSPLDAIQAKVLELVALHPKLVGDWKEIVFRSYIYGKGTKISWHDDNGYTAAAIFYTHPYWSASWGGELQLAETSTIDRSKIGGPLETWWTDNIMGHLGCGYYIQPKPNRMVLTSGRVWHAINRVDENAGNNCRCSIVAFFRSTPNS
jgi:Rps23 Pro-64 3,4-dihydroxylase Tpa1-like proline 4-hydroxylase